MPRRLVFVASMIAGLCPLGFGACQEPTDPFAAHVSRAGPRSPEEERKAFHLPPGFDIELVAAEPYVRKPININFDDRGRIWVSESIEYPFAVPPERRGRDTVRILEDRNGDGLADEVTTFTDGLSIPIGVLPVRRGAIIYSIPNIYRFEDRDGDDRADERRLLYGTFGHKDTHGMTGEFSAGFDGWIYACHGFANTSVIRGGDGSQITMTSGHTYRFRPDGSRVEYWTHGQVNPFGLAWDPLGNLYSCDCHSRPIYMLLRGAYYPSFARPDDGMGFGPEMMSHDHGSTAIAGITYYAADQFPPEYRDTIFIGNVVTNCINHDRLERHGSTLLAIKQPDFLTCDDPWFRPVDIKLGPDGALYVADFYNRIIGHYEVPLTHPGRDRQRGRIWRIIYRGPDGKGRPRSPRSDWNKASIAELIADLGHANLVVRMKATNQLVERGGRDGADAVRAAMRDAGSAFVRMHGLWALERSGHLDEATVRSACVDQDPGVRVHAMRVLSERQPFSAQERALVFVALADRDAQVRRAAADALGTHPAAENIGRLLALRQVVPADDTHLLHVVRMALREQLRPSGDWSACGVDRLPEKHQRALADVATGVSSLASARFLAAHLTRHPEPRANQLRYVYHVARHGTESLIAEVFELARGDVGAGLLHQAGLFRNIEQGMAARGATPGSALREWGEMLARRLLESNLEDELLAGIEIGGALKLGFMRDTCRALVADTRAQAPARESAADALLALDARGSIPFFGQLLAASTEPITLRRKAANLLAAARDPAAHDELLRGLRTAPERLGVTIAGALALTREGGERLLSAVAEGKASPQLLQERWVEQRLDQAKVPRFKERIAELTQGLPPADAHYQEALERRRGAFAIARKDPAQGAKVFEKNCAVCHQIANQGARIGPQLDGIGVRGLDRLLEDIVDPSRNVDQAFRVTTLELKNGQIISGLLLREEGQVLVLADSRGQEVRVAGQDVTDRTLSQLSPMPVGLPDQMSDADFNNLLAFLLAQQPAKVTPLHSPASKAGR
jgi:putative heme-binding domain-containing protein